MPLLLFLNICSAIVGIEYGCYGCLVGPFSQAHSVGEISDNNAKTLILPSKKQKRNGATNTSSERAKKMAIK